MVKGNVYSLYEIIKKFGGNIQSSMPLSNGKVLYTKFNPKINPKFPDEVWIEEGPIRKKGAEYLAKCKEPINVFEKIAPQKWRYLGTTRFSEKCSPNELKKINKNPPRNKIQVILKLHGFK